MKALAIISATVALVLAVAGPLFEPALLPEVFRVVLQFLFVVILGGMLAQFFKERDLRRAEQAKALEEKRQQEEAHRLELQQAYSDLLSSYNGAKRTRRLIRGTAILGSVHEPEALVDLKQYRRHMEQLIDVQLDLEALKRRGRAGLWQELRGLADETERMEKYLGRIVHEYENLSPNDGDTIPLGSLPRLAEFVGSYKLAKRFRSRFMSPHSRALKTLSTSPGLR